MAIFLESEIWPSMFKFIKNRNIPLILLNARITKKSFDRWNKIRKFSYSIFSLIDKLIFLKVPSFKHVYKWRLLQEKKLRLTGKGKKTMSDNQIKRFIMFYERITKHMIKKTKSPI